MPSGRRHYRINLADAETAHYLAQQTGGLVGPPNWPLVESAIARPYDGYHRSISQKAAALVHGVAKNHGFVDGNKRTAIILMHLLLTRSRYRLEALPGENLQDVVERMVLAVVEDQLSYDDLVGWFQARIEPQA